MEEKHHLDELGVGHNNIKIRAIYIIFFLVFLGIGLSVYGTSVKGGAFGPLGLVLARIMVGVFFDKKTEEEKEEEYKKNSKERFKKMFQNNSNTFGPDGL
tara:strand:- start:1154 stop:1453 length:300 start_codon:yes stop_codon:yes gene_type:complete